MTRFELFLALAQSQQPGGPIIVKIEQPAAKSELSGLADVLLSRAESEIDTLMRERCGGNRRLGLDFFDLASTRALQALGISLLDLEGGVISASVISSASATNAPDLSEEIPSSPPSQGVTRCIRLAVPFVVACVALGCSPTDGSSAAPNPFITGQSGAGSGATAGSSVCGS
jgi:hypothetical protein